jgi:hypothetical protein
MITIVQKDNRRVPTESVRILENTTTDTVADSATTGNFFPNENINKNKHNGIEVVCANNQTMTSVATTEELDMYQIYQVNLKQHTAGSG